MDSTFSSDSALRIDPVRLQRSGAVRCDDAVGMHPSRAWISPGSRHVDTFKTPVHEAAEAGQLAVLRYFVHKVTYTHTHTRKHTRTCLTALFQVYPGEPVPEAKPIWILLKQETVRGNGISWALCKSAPRSRQITTPAPHHSVFYRPDALPAAQPTASKH